MSTERRDEMKGISFGLFLLFLFLFGVFGGGDSEGTADVRLTFGKRMPIQNTTDLCPDGEVFTVEAARDEETDKIVLTNLRCEPLSAEQ